VEKEIIIPKKSDFQNFKEKTGISGSVETHMNGSSHPNHESRNIYENLPPQGLSEAWRGKDFFYDTSTDPLRGRPAGEGGIHRIPGFESLNLHNYAWNM
jgi:hypothetical protein